MKFGLFFSLLFHSLLLLGVLWKTQSSQPLVRRVSPVELLSSQAFQAPRKKKVAGVKVKKKSKTIKKDKLLNRNSNKNKLGDSDENLSEIKARGLQPSQAAVVSYGSELQEYIEKNRYYPKRAMLMEQTGQVVLRLVITSEGVFDKVEIIKPAKFEILNRAAKELLINLKAFKPLPDNFPGSGEFIIPVNYQIKSGSI